MTEIAKNIAACRLCTDRFAQTKTQHMPRPVPWFEAGARILIAGQAPGLRVHETGVPFNDRSGERLRDWMGVGPDVFYDKSRVAIVPMAFCFPGYDAKGSDLPPPPICRATWHDAVMQALPEQNLKLVIGGYAQRYHLGTRSSVTDTVAEWRDHAPRVFPLPHPSWRNTAWLKKNPWFEAELLPELRAAVKRELT